MVYSQGQASASMGQGSREGMQVSAARPPEMVYPQGRASAFMGQGSREGTQVSATRPPEMVYSQGQASAFMGQGSREGTQVSATRPPEMVYSQGQASAFMGQGSREGMQVHDAATGINANRRTAGIRNSVPVGTERHRHRPKLQAGNAPVQGGRVHVLLWGKVHDHERSLATFHPARLLD